MNVNVLSLFAGIGGLELGLEWAGMHTVGQVERDPYCLQVLARHWPDVPRHADVETAPAWWGSQERPTVDLVCAGFPCQPFSIAGLRQGTGDERWGWPWTAAVIRAVRPRFVLLENVAALIRDGAAFGTVLGDLADLGFDAEWAVLRASDMGAPHRRERVYVLAHPPLSDGAHPDQPSTARAFQLEPRGSGRERGRPYWLPEPAVDRVAHGVPRAVVHDPLHALGNAVVPQIARHIGRLVMNHLEGEAA